MSEHGTHHHEAENADRNKSNSSFRSSFWFMLILVGLFIGALNFIQVMGHGSAHEAEAHTQTEAHQATEIQTAPESSTPAPSDTSHGTEEPASESTH